jgi:cytochrome P450
MFSTADRWSGPTSVPAVPSPPLPAVVQTLLYGLWPERYLHWCAARLGDRFTLSLPGMPTSVVLADPAEAREVFRLRTDQIALDGSLLEPFLGPKSLLCQGGEIHDRQRRLLATAFRADALARWADEIDVIVAGEVATWPVGRRIRLLPRLRAIALEVILRVAFGIDAADRLDGLRASLRPFLHGAGSLVVLNPGFRRELLGLSPWARFRRLRSRVLAALSAEVALRRTATDLDERTDLLSLLLRAEHDGRRLDDSEVLDNLLTMVVAGHDTTATALAWAFDLLVHHPDELERLSAGIDHGDRTQLGAVIKESMRLRPVILDTGRTLRESVEIGGATYPQGTVLTPCILLAHRDPVPYPRPLEFRPERFLGHDLPDPVAWIPFGGGVRRCIGAGFAMLEMEAVIRTVLRLRDVSAARSRPDTQKRRAITVVPRHGAQVVVRPRRDTA